MTGQRRLHRNLGGLTVANFPDHHHVRVLTQNGAQPAGKGHVHARVNLRLPHPFQLVLNRIFHGQNVAFVAVQRREYGVQRGTFTGTRRAGNEDDPVRAVDQPFQLLQLFINQPQLVDVGLEIAFIEQAHHHALAVLGRNGRDAHVDGLATDAQGDTAILREAFLGDVEFRHHLDTRHQQRGELTRRLQHRAQHAVNAKAYAQGALEGFDMNIRRAVLHRLAENGVDQADHRRVFVVIEQIFVIRDLLG